MKMKKTLFSRLAMCGIAALMISCGAPSAEKTLSGLDPARFRAAVNGCPTDLYRLTNDAGMEVCVTNFGARIVSVMAPDREGTMRDVVLGFDNIDDYIHVPSDFGAAIGSYANRIGHGQFVLDGDTVRLPVNNYGHCLHGGPDGWQYKVYEAHRVDGRTLELTLHSPDGDAGFPGAVTAKVTYRLTDDNAIEISYEAQSDRPTVINMTNHSYFNLSGDPSHPILDNLLTVNAECYTPVDSTFMTTGSIDSVAGTPFDFRRAKAIGAEIDADNEQLHNGHGYDHNWVLATNGDLSQRAARLVSPVSGIALDVYTDEPGIQIYVGNFLDGTVTGKNGVPYAHRTAVCLETQHYPDSPNKPQWPSVVLRPGETYHSHCTYRFSVER